MSDTTPTMTAALKEAYATAKSSIILIETIEFVNPLQGSSSLFFVKSKADLTATLETGVSTLFTACSFQFTTPQQDNTGVPEMTVTIDNLNHRVSDFIEAVKHVRVPTLLKYRVYLSTALNAPQTNPPLQLTIKTVTYTHYQAQLVASFADVRNKKFLSERYTRFRFVGLGG